MTLAPDISVIIVTYNQALTIERAVRSVLAQDVDSVASMEIVLADDCSTDGTSDVCRRLAERHAGVVRYVRNDSNLGLTKNYYQALARCRGRYVADCAGDDFWTDPTRLLRQYELMERNPDVTICHTGWQYYHEDTGAVSPSDPDGLRAQFCPPMTDGRLLLPHIVGHTAGCIVHLCTALYRRDTLVGRYGLGAFFSAYDSFACEDLQIVACLAAVGRVAYLPEVTLSYSVGHDSVSAPDCPARVYRFHSSVYRLTQLLEKRFGIDPSYTERYYGQTRRYLALQMYLSGDAALRRDFTAGEWSGTLDVKSRLAVALSEWRPVWMLSLFIRKLLKCLSWKPRA